MGSQTITGCQICNSKNLENILFLGYIPPVTTLHPIGDLPKEETFYPLNFVRCPKCTLVQIDFEVDPEKLFTKDYAYMTSVTRILRDNFADLYRESSAMLKLKPEDFIVEFGSNDGTLLSNFKNAGHKVLGVEPTGIADIANKNGINTKNVFFGKQSAADIKKEFGQAKVILATNVFAHIVDINSVVDGIIDLLTPDGVFISESHYVLPLVQTLQYDTIYHEHLRNYSVRSIRYLLESRGLEVFFAKQVPTHGGSIRIYAGKKGQHPIDASVGKMIEVEDKEGLTDGTSLKTFRDRVIKSKLDLFVLLAPLKSSGARIYGIGAPARACMIVNYLGLDDGSIDAVMEVKTSPKVNKYMPGTRIPIYDEAKLYVDQPEYALIFSWHIADELVKILREKGYKGKFIIPLPEPRILDI
ncbi:MAG: class I SAM-dependent methyltransferase [Patescibacteria group bacterium]